MLAELVGLDDVPANGPALEMRSSFCTFCQLSFTLHLIDVTVHQLFFITTQASLSLHLTPIISPFLRLQPPQHKGGLAEDGGKERGHNNFVLALEKGKIFKLERSEGKKPGGWKR